MRAVRVAAVAAVMLPLAACSGTEGPAEAPVPDGVSVFIDQSRVERLGRTVFLRVHNGTSKNLEVSSFTVSSPRFSTFRGTSGEMIGATYDTDLEFRLPPGRCGTSVDASATLTYRLDGGPLLRSAATADDKYANVAGVVDRDCARTTLERAADVTVGTPSVAGGGASSVLNLPVTMTPTGRATDVRFGGFGSTVLFRQAPGSPTDVDVPMGADDPPANLTMSVVPARCDPHALAEDKVGRLFPVTVLAPGVGEDATYYLPLTRAQRAVFFDFFRSHCGLP